MESEQYNCELIDKRDRLKAITLTQKLYGLDVPTIVMLLDLLLDIPVNIRPDIKIRFSYCLTHPGPTKHISQHSNTHFTIKGRALWSDHSISIFILWSDQGVWDSWSGEQDVFLDGLPDMLRMQQYAKIMMQPETVEALKEAIVSLLHTHCTAID